jgi:NADH-quinone oxidoreductase subunit M
MHTREIAAYGGLVHRMPRYAFTFMFFTLASVGLPGLSGFVGEFLVLIGTFKVDALVTVFAASGMVLAAAYALILVQRAFHGPVRGPDTAMLQDLNGRELATMLTLMAVLVWLGLDPQPALNLSAAPMHAVQTLFQQAAGTAAAAPGMP